MPTYGDPEILTSLVRRIIAPNPGPMTGDGTNTYLVGEHELAVIDPGPDIPEHIDALLKSGQERIRWILCTHTHPDHSPAAAILKEKTGAKVVGAFANDGLHQDTSFSPDLEINDDEIIHGDGWDLRAIWTPGHVSNHYCYLLEQQGIVFAGDHIMNGSTVVIVPPGGDMTDYINSLRRILDYEIKYIAPGHGDLIPDCRAEVEKLVAHRLGRERKVLAGLKSISPANLDELVVIVYTDVDSSLHEWAKLSMTAHLIKLEREGHVFIDKEDRWVFKR